MREDRKTGDKKTLKQGSVVRRQEKAYGDNAPICINAECVMRKKAKCLGFEGCPGFKGK